MIIWLNGSFGVGKTTVAHKLKERIDDAIIYDPEEIGGFLSDTLPVKEDDFQDYELWRKFNYEILKFLNFKFPCIIVPMTVTSLQYYDEIVGKLLDDGIVVKDFILIASKENLIKRLDKRENSTEWAYNQVSRCVEVFESDFSGEKIDTNNRNSDEVVLKIVNLIEKRERETKKR